MHVVGPKGNQSVRELMEIAENEGVGASVYFVGPTNEPLKYFAGADCALLCSDYEGLPGSVLEALACGTPVVGSDIGPVREVSQLTSGVQIVPVSDLEGWAKAMRGALDLDRAKIKEDFWVFSPFSLHKHAAAMLELWSSLSHKG